MHIINQKVYKRLIRGLEQRIWYLGIDALQLENNLLVKYGFDRYRTSDHIGSSRYKIKWGSTTVEIHSLCLGIYGNNQDGFLYVRSPAGAYVYTDQTPTVPGNYRTVFLTRPVDVDSKQHFHKASSAFLEWLEDYESWIEETLGKNYRLDCYERYKRDWLPPNEAMEWFRQYRMLGTDSHRESRQYLERKIQ
ncbi:MAG: hypothetical protein ACI9Z7_000725 [Alteromonas macleodii]|jgi:hypothetical protein